MAILTGISGDNKLMLMTSTFDVLSETPLHTEEYGEGNDKPQRARSDR
jgi:elongator complex protein 1